MTLLVVLLGVAVGILAVIVFGLLRTHAEILRALDRAGVSLDPDSAVLPASVALSPTSGAVPAERVAEIRGTVPGGGPAKIALDGSHHTLLAFLSSGCRTCQEFWDAFRDPQLELPGESTRLVIVAQDPIHDSESRLQELAPRGVRLVCSSATWQALEVPGSPYFVLVDGNDRSVVGSGTATAWGQVYGLLERAVEDSKPSSAGYSSTDEALNAAGIGPGHPSLYPDTNQDSEASHDPPASDEVSR